MSFWFHRKDAEGRTYLLSVSFPLLYCLMMVLLLVSLLTSVIRWLLDLFR